MGGEGWEVGGGWAGNTVCEDLYMRGDRIWTIHTDE